MATTHVKTIDSGSPSLSSDSLLLILPPHASLASVAEKIPPELRKPFIAATTRFDFKSRPSSFVTFEVASLRIIVAVTPKSSSTFSLLSWSRKVIAHVRASRAKSVGVWLSLLNSETAAIAASLVSASEVAYFEPTKYGQKAKSKKEKKLEFNFYSSTPISSPSLDYSIKEAQATNLVRHLAMLAGNDATPSRYVAMAQALAKQNGLRSKFYSLADLRKMGAGAFVAVAQGSADPGPGILRIDYMPKKPTLKLALVGKGLTFDTGGNNLKTAHMFGMHEDMTGSAVALALICLIKQLELPYQVSAYLAITDNVLSPEAYRPNDVVTSLKGLAIEVIDTDAEGRMVLADTLTLASKDKPTLIIDFATLTGACARAIGKTYSGVFSNRRRLFNLLVRAGRRSGERVWPFPNDKDFGDCLKSDVADIKQCRLSGGTDHIEAAYFLSQFVDSDIPWIHVDLSSHSCEGGLAHIPTKTTGFGVRFSMKFIELFASSFKLS